MSAFEFPHWAFKRAGAPMVILKEARGGGRRLPLGNDAKHHEAQHSRRASFAPTIFSPSRSTRSRSSPFSCFNLPGDDGHRAAYERPVHAGAFPPQSIILMHVHCVPPRACAQGDAAMRNSWCAGGREMAIWIADPRRLLAFPFEFTV
jgi:hypothetical protein